MWLFHQAEACSDRKHSQIPLFENTTTSTAILIMRRIVLEQRTGAYLSVTQSVASAYRWMPYHFFSNKMLLLLSCKIVLRLTLIP